MLLFRSEEKVDRWCEARGRPRGETVLLDSLATLAAAWYGDRLDSGWRPRMAERSQALLAEAGLVSDFWRLA